MVWRRLLAVCLKKKKKEKKNPETRTSVDYWRNQATRRVRRVSIRREKGLNVRLESTLAPSFSFPHLLSHLPKHIASSPLTIKRDAKRETFRK